MGVAETSSRLGLSCKLAMQLHLHDIASAVILFSCMCGSEPLRPCLGAAGALRGQLFEFIADGSSKVPHPSGRG